jgi:hypothetical protein
MAMTSSARDASTTEDDGEEAGVGVGVSSVEIVSVTDPRRAVRHRI